MEVGGQKFTLLTKVLGMVCGLQFLLLLDQLLAVFIQFTGHPLNQFIGLLGYPIALSLILVVVVQELRQASKVLLTVRKSHRCIGFLCQTWLAFFLEKKAKLLEPIAS